MNYLSAIALHQILQLQNTLLLCWRRVRSLYLGTASTEAAVSRSAKNSFTTLANARE
jgi:hypothetical protein